MVGNPVERRRGWAVGILLPAQDAGPDAPDGPLERTCQRILPASAEDAIRTAAATRPPADAVPMQDDDEVVLTGWSWRDTDSLAREIYRAANTM
jgi:hypothetical protein